MPKKMFIESDNIASKLEKYMKIQLSVSLQKFTIVYACSTEYSPREWRWWRAELSLFLHPHFV